MKLQGCNRSTSTAAIIDCGATALFLDHPFITQNHITTFPLRHPINLLNIDGSPNTGGNITHFACLNLSVGPHEDWTDFLVADLGGENVILGLPWLRKANPLINWTTGLVRINPRPIVEEVPEPPTGNTLGKPTGGSIVEEIYAAVPLNQKAVLESPKISVLEPLGSQKAVPEPVKVKASEPLNPQKAVPASPGLLASEPLVEESDSPFCRI